MEVRWAVAAAVAYLLGSIPWGLLIGRAIYGVDVREYGSHRTGATNVLRTLGKKAATAALLLDLSKSVAAILFARWLLPQEPWAHVLAAVAAAAGHNWPIFCGFRGGRGVVVSAGAIAVLYPPAILAITFVGIFVIWRTRYVSLGSVLGGAVAPLLMLIAYLQGQIPLAYFVYGIVGAIIVIGSHRDNIARLMAGTEARLGQGARRVA